jgi:putative photosynthetic complex assembly protein
MSALPSPRSRALPIGWLLGLMALTLAAVGMARWQGWHDQVPDAPTVWEMTLKFEDMPDGSVRVRDASNDRTLAVFAGEQGFLRGSLRAMARQRRVAQAERQAPLVLRGLADGRLVLMDPTHGERIDLDSFGPSNKAVFARLRTATPKDEDPGAKP